MKQTIRRLAALLLCAATLFAFTAAAAAEESVYSDVASDAWYAASAAGLREKGIMEGIGNGRFNPDGVFNRAQLAAVLYRMAGRPAVQGSDSFTDTPEGAWYSDAVLWAAQNGIVGGYGDGRYGPADPVTQQQLAVMLWRDAGSYVLGSEYADENGVENSAGAWAFDAVRWARVEGLLSDAAAFEPLSAAPRARVADMVWRYLQLKERFAAVDAVSGATKETETGTDTDEGSRVLVAYFSCTGTTEKVAGQIAGSLGVTAYRITPETPYTSEDLNYSDNSTRATREQRDASARPAITGSVENMDDYDVIFLGYPIWWGQAPKIMYTFVESYDLSGKTIVPFCTSGSSDIGSSAVNLAKSAPNATWLAGSRFSGSASGTTLSRWIEGLGLGLNVG